MSQHICIQGALGAGKTFLASTLAHHWRNGVRQQQGDIKLFSNYGLMDSKMMQHYTDWYEVAEAQGSIIIWDEAHLNFDSRTALKASSIFSTQLLIYTRKMKSIQMYCTPTILNLDSRIRNIVEVLINVRKNGKKGISIDFFDYQSKQFGSMGKYLHSKYIPASRMKRIFGLNLLDTDKMVMGFPMPTTEREQTKFLAEIVRIHDDSRQNKKVVQMRV